MSGQLKGLPQQIDPFRLAAKEAQLQGQLPLSQMKRLTSLLNSSEGEVDIDLSLHMASSRVVMLQGHVHTQIDLICQRCLEAFKLPLDVDINLALARTEQDLESISDDIDAQVVEDTTIMLTDLIEDELLLVLPSIPKHEVDKCPATKLLNQLNEHIEHSENVKPSNPFDVLANLKSGKQDEA